MNELTAEGGKMRIIKEFLEDVKEDPKANLILPVITSVLVYTALSLLTRLLQLE